MAIGLEEMEFLAQTGTQLWVLQHVPAGIFIFMFGACMGSFLNVVNYRIPAGLSITTPPSRCPACNTKLKFFTENLPILGWLLLRGKCKHCGIKISSEYVLAEFLMGLAFLGLYLVYFAIPGNVAWWGEVGGPWWRGNGIFRAWPVFVVHVTLLGALFSMTVIDLRTFSIPIEIPTVLTIVAFIAYPVQALLPLFTPSAQPWPIPLVEWEWVGLAVGGMLGVLFSSLLLKMGVLRYSFHDYEEYVEEGEILGDYPHARREMLVELGFLIPCFIGLAGGWFIGAWCQESGIALPLWVQALGATLLGYLVGGGLVWGIRILGTLGFGREAMGMGDVHLLAAVGAALGWCDPIRIFFLAPFFGLLWALLAVLLGRMFKSVDRQIPYGPHLALATVLVILCRPGIDWFWGTVLGLPCG